MSTLVRPTHAQERSAADVAREIGLSNAAVERVIAGEIVAEELPSSSDKDLALAAVMRLDAPPSAVFRFVDSDRLTEVQTKVVAEGPIDPASFSLDDMTLPEESVKRLMRRKDGSFSLSQSEAERVRAATREGESAALDAYRAVLAERARAYWQGGPRAIAPYAGSNRSPADDLEAANRATRQLTRLPAFEAELETAPAKSPGGAEHTLFWVVLKGRDVAAPVLLHRIRYREDDAEIVVARHFYSGYDYDALQIMVAVLPTPDDWSAVFYTNHTYTSHVTGFGGGAKRSIGRQLLRQELVAELERAQRVIPDFAR